MVVDGASWYLGQDSSRHECMIKTCRTRPKRSTFHKIPPKVSKFTINCDSWNHEQHNVIGKRSRTRGKVEGGRREGDETRWLSALLIKGHERKKNSFERNEDSERCVNIH